MPLNLTVITNKQKVQGTRDNVVTYQIIYNHTIIQTNLLYPLLSNNTDNTYNIDNPTSQRCDLPKPFVAQDEEAEAENDERFNSWLARVEKDVREGHRDRRAAEYDEICNCWPLWPASVRSFVYQEEEDAVDEEEQEEEEDILVKH